MIRKKISGRVSMPADAVFRTSSFTNTYYCVEAAFDGHTVRVRDTKNRAGGTLAFNLKEWDAFIKGVKGGEFDLPN